MKDLKGLFKCDVHKESFNTPIEWRDHCHDNSHRISGTSICGVCGEEGIEFDGNYKVNKQTGNPTVFCADCKEQLVEGIANE